MNVAVDGVSCLHDPETDERKFQLVAEKAQGVQDDALFPPRPCENVVDLIENEDLDTNVSKRVDGAPLHIDDAGTRAMRRVDGAEDLREEPLRSVGRPLSSTTSSLLGFDVESVAQLAAQSALNLSTNMDFPIPLSP